MPRGAPSMIFSSESVKSAICDLVVAAAGGEQRRLVGEVGEVGADHARGGRRRARRGRRRGRAGSPRVWTRRIAARPARSGGCTTTRRSKRPGRSSAESSTSGRLVAASTTTASVGSKPSISVRIWSSVCSRSSLAPVTLTEPWRERPIASSSSMKMIAGAAARACVNRSRTRDAPTPTIASMNSDAEIEKNAAWASPATARASSVLPVPGAPGEQHAVRHPPAEAAVAVGVLEEVDDLGQLGLGLVDPGDVGEGDADLLCGSTRRARERPNWPSAPIPPPPPAARRAMQTKQADEQQRRAEAEQDLGEHRGARGRRLGVDLDAVARSAAPRAGCRSRTPGPGSRTASSASPSSSRRVAHLRLEGALDGVALGRDRADLAGARPG